MSENENIGVGSQVYHPSFGRGVVVEVSLGTFSIYFKNRGEKEVPRNDDRLEIRELVADTIDRLSLSEVETALENVLRKWSDATEITDLGDKWKGGTLIMKPNSENLKSKELPIESFFHKIVMTRDRLRVMEQKINASKNMDDEEKVALQQYITRIYGSLTTFNVLFARKEDHFSGTGS